MNTVLQTVYGEILYRIRFVAVSTSSRNSEPGPVGLALPILAFFLYFIYPIFTSVVANQKAGEIGPKTALTQKAGKEGLAWVRFLLCHSEQPQKVSTGDIEEGSGNSSRKKKQEIRESSRRGKSIIPELKKKSSFEQKGEM